MGEPKSSTCHVVIVDDDVNNADVIRLFVTMAGHRATTVSVRDAESLMEAVLRLQPDVGLFDLHLGCADARDVARALRESGCVAYLVAMTGHAMEPSDSLSAGFDQHWSKPIDLEIFERVLRERARGTLMSVAERAPR
ncbi:MAG TPA: response regulator [Tahibacter sp.]|nr:response regulator [Tahibacter sp.]